MSYDTVADRLIPANHHCELGAGGDVPGSAARDSGSRGDRSYAMFAKERVPVLIVGAGGAGLSLSLLLRQRGIATVLVEQRSDVSWYPRARNLNFRSLYSAG